MRLSDLKTPAALVDLDRLEANAGWALGRARDLGVRLRPHVKTHKCPPIGRIQSGGTPGPVTVSTLAEARAFASDGFRDMTYAVPPAPGRFPEVLEFTRTLTRFACLVDSEQTAALLEAFGDAHGARFTVLLKVDCGYHRCGADPDGKSALALARRLAASPCFALEGVLTHAGQSYAARTREETLEAARTERDVLAGFARRLRESGIEAREVSVGSTPTFAAADHLTGVTEARPGNYVFFDAFQAASGTCRLEIVAFSVLATVVGSYPERGAVVVDAGALALSKDPGPVHVDPECGFGVPCDLEGRPLPGLRVASLTQEHGRIEGPPGTLARLPPGSLLRILPNHSCLSAACFGRYAVHRGPEVVDEWAVARGW
jgi:D-serine deaminase-like pyridoxal phosphate-dependent protein